VPTTRPRFTFTDTGEVSDLLRRAAARWPEVAHDRKELMLRLARAGAVSAAADAVGADDRRQRQLAALTRARDRIDAELLLSDAAWS
jgi:hypothetical protein